PIRHVLHFVRTRAWRGRFTGGHEWLASRAECGFIQVRWPDVQRDVRPHLGYAERIADARRFSDVVRHAALPVLVRQPDRIDRHPDDDAELDQWWLLERLSLLHQLRRRYFTAVECVFDPLRPVRPENARWRPSGRQRAVLARRAKP